MHRFYIPPARWKLEALALDEAEAHHARDVLRLGPGDRVTVFNGEGAQAEAEITALTKRAATLKTLRHAVSAPLPARITLAQAVPKGKNMELIVQKATELGAAGVVPLLTERTIARFDAAEAERKRGKWQAIAVEAAKQCGQNWLPVVHRPQGLEEFFTALPPFELLLVGSLQPGAVHPRCIFEEAARRLGRKPQSALVLIGPEGDFTPGEVELALAHGCRPITLGPIILRTETAALFCLSVLGYELLGEP